MKTHKLPRIDCVVIGVNAGKTLMRCVESVRAAKYPRELVNITYVDGGSSDASVSLASECEYLNTIAMNLRHPTPGRGRNTGWRTGDAPFVMFLDADTIMAPGWLLTAVGAMKDDVGAVYGCRKEMNPQKSVFNWIGDLEWNEPSQDAGCFGGDVMIMREVLEATDGYDNTLVAGEDPELGHRVRQAGWRILGLDAPMTRHDLSMLHFSQYWKRSIRTGYAYAEVSLRYVKGAEKFWWNDLLRICLRGGLGMLLALSGVAYLPFAGAPVALALALFAIAAGVFVIAKPILKTRHFSDYYSLTNFEGLVYAVHTGFVVIPQFFGVLRYVLGKFFGLPLKNNGGGDVL